MFPSLAKLVNDQLLIFMCSQPFLWRVLGLALRICSVWSPSTALAGKQTLFLPPHPQALSVLLYLLTGGEGLRNGLKFLSVGSQRKALSLLVLNWPD